MPSSSGGGFGGGGGGGSFGGGFHSSGSHSSSNQPRGYSSHPYPGATRYCYPNRYGYMCVFYSAGRPRRVKPFSAIFPLIAGIVIVLLCATLIIFSSIPRKIPESYCKKTSSFYEDNAGIVTNAEELNSSFEAFYENTGIQPYLYTIKSENFPKQYGNITKYTLEDYAYDLYLDLFKDEGHWLIVFVEFDSSPYFGWIDMAGDNTRNIISDSFFDNFQQDMQSMLNSESTTTKNYSQAISKSITNANEHALDFTSNNKFLIIFISIAAAAALAFLIYAIVKNVKQALMVNGYLDYVEQNPGKEAETYSKPENIVHPVEDRPTDPFD